MGYSYTYAASAAMDRIERACKASREQRSDDDGASNTFFANGKRYFYELRRRDRPDGGLGGEIWVTLPDGVHCRKVGTFVIDGRGRVLRGPALFRNAASTR